ncbi:hypothetical protein D3OALGB2SA_1202 [Olavius algarvensis associated proteobacterium Delta 3]|nr:hypothetical protein D3OALGB2SA_1202 [Olavius algarvensis associated proteobacterium Delta 3]
MTFGHEQMDVYQLARKYNEANHMLDQIVAMLTKLGQHTIGVRFCRAVARTGFIEPSLAP